MFWLEALVFMMVWAGFWLIVDGFSRKGRERDLAKRLARFQPLDLGDQAERWLKERREEFGD